MNVTFYVYDLYTKRMRGKDKIDVSNFEHDFIEVVSHIMSRLLTDRKREVKGNKKIIYLTDYEYSESERTIFLRFSSVKYANIRNVMNTKTMMEDPSKKKSNFDGDEETTCMCIRFSHDHEDALCMVQSNSNGVSMSAIMGYINEMILDYHQNGMRDMVRYNILFTNVVSKEFIEALESTKRIKMVKLCMDSTEVSSNEFKNLSEKVDLSTDFDIIFRPAKKGLSIEKDTIKEFFKAYKDNSRKIRRIYVDSDNLDGNPLTFDTEKIKQKERKDITESITGEPNVVEMKQYMLSQIKLY